MAFFLYANCANAFFPAGGIERREWREYFQFNLCSNYLLCGLRSFAYCLLPIANCQLSIAY